MNHAIRLKTSRMTALAAACAMMFSIPAIAATETPAAEVESATTEATASANAPSAVDSSRRIIRRAQASATPTSTIPTDVGTADNATPTDVVPNPDAATPRVNNASATTPSNNAPLNSIPTPRLPQTQTQTAAPVASEEQTPATRVYQRGPITSKGVDISSGQLPNIPVPQVRISDIDYIPTVLIDQQQGANSGKLDVSMLDDFIADVSPNARHYPPNFPNRTQRYNAREKIKVLTEWIEPYANASDASYDVLIRAAKLNGMGRNLDLGSEYAVRGGQYVDRAIKRKTDSGEANFLYGMMLAEGGGFKEGKKYLDRAVELGYTEAEQSLAQSDLLSDRRDAALDRLRRLEQQVPDNDIIRKQIKIIEDGKFYIWDLSAPDVNVKPSS